MQSDLLYEVNSNLSNQIYALEQVNQKLRTSLSGVTDIIKILQSDVWQGQSKKTALDLLSIFHTYHAKLIEASEMNLSAMKVLDDKATSYMSSGAIPVLWRSDGPSKSFKEKVATSLNQASDYVYKEACEAGEYVSEKANEAGEYLSEKANEAGESISETANEVGQFVSNIL